MINTIRSIFYRSISLFFIVLGFSSYTSGQQLEWAKLFEYNNDVSVQAHDMMEDSCHVLIGTFIGTVDFDLGTGVYSVTENNLSLFILKLDVDGNFMWVQTITTNSSTDYIGAKDIQLDGNNNIIAVARFASSQVDVDPGPGIQNVSNGTGGYRSFVLKLNSQGTYLWHELLITSSSLCMDLDVNNDIIVAGSFESSISVGSIYLSALSLLTEGFVSKISSTGTVLWAGRIGGTASGSLCEVYVNEICTDVSGNIYYSGIFDQTVDFNPAGTTYNLTGAGQGKSYFQSKLDGNGTFIYARKFENTDYGVGIHDIVANDAGEVFSTGQRHLNSSNYFYTRKTNASGLTEWVRFIQTSDLNTYSNAIDIDNDDYVYISGKSYDDSIDLNPGVGINYLHRTGTTSNGFILKLNENGNYVWSMSAHDSLPITQSLNYYSEDYMDLYVANGGAIYVVNTSGESSIFKLDQGICSTLSVDFGNVTNVHCNQTAVIETEGAGGSLPYSYLWSAPDNSTDSVLNTFNPGIHTITLTDNLGCDFTTSVWLTGPSSQSFFDSDVHLIADEFRPGFSSNLWVDAFNDGCQSISGNLKLIMDTSLTLNYGWPAPDAINGDTLIWNYSNLTYDSLHLTPFVNVNTSTQAQIGDSIQIHLIITPVSGDDNPANNDKHYVFPVVNGYDPNKKSVYPVGKCEAHYIESDQELTYTIRFQNTGNSEAIHIIVSDTIDNDLDLSTFRVVASSHPVYATIENSNIVDFNFDNIHLPDSTSNEIESHGYVIFKIKPNSGLSHNTLIENSVSIYFDFNPPVITNTVYNSVYDDALFGSLDDANCYDLGTQEMNSTDFLIYPNPASGSVYVTFSQPFSGDVNIRSVEGEVIYRKSLLESQEMHLDMNSFSNGLYFFEFISKDKISVLKLIKN